MASSPTFSGKTCLDPAGLHRHLQASYWETIRDTLAELDEDCIPTVEYITPLARAKWEAKGNRIDDSRALTMDWVISDYEKEWNDPERPYSLTNRPTTSWEKYVPIFILNSDFEDDD
jgi:hypothetical protein